MGKYRIWLAAALAFGGSGGAWAQETATPIGPAELRDFSLPGTPPPRQDPEPAPAPTEAETPQPVPAPTVTPTPPASEPPRTAAPRPAPARVQPAPEVAPPETAAEVAPETSAEIVPSPVPAPPETVASTPAPAPQDGGSSWLWPALAALAALSGLALWKTGLLANMTRRTGQAAEPDELMLTQVAASAQPKHPAAEPAAVRAPMPALPDADEGPRPRIEIVFKPAKAEATDTGTSVHYELIVKNLGTALAHDVRVEARMFNAGPDQDAEIGGFFAAPLQEKLVTRPFDIPARSQAKLSRVVAMSNEQVRVITIQGRRLFIPMVAFNVLYDRGEGETGQTSRCFVVGREKEIPSEKMGAFRLDLGPRIYRSVGQRQTKLAHIA